MFSSRRFNNLINRIHERSLRTVYNDTSFTFQELLQRNRSLIIHHKNIQTLTTEVFKVVNKICPSIMKISEKTDLYQKISRNETTKSKNCPEWSRNCSLSGSSSMVSCSCGSLPNVNQFQSKAKHWECTQCPCKLCKTYLRNIVYL